MSNYQIMPLLADSEYQALKDDIAKRGIIIPIELDEDGNILDGHHRLKALNELYPNGNKPDYPRVIRAGMNEEEKRNYIRALNVLRRHLTKEQQKQIWIDMRADGATYQEIAKATGTPKSTIADTLSSFPISENSQPATVTGKDGKKYPSTKKRNKKPNPPQAPLASVYAATDKAETIARAKAQKIAENGSEGASQPVQVTIFSNEIVEYYTPPEILEAARAVLGIIDLDPASCAEAQQNVKAGEYFTEQDDGMTKSWYGKVWLNPPYSKTGNRSNQELWSQRLVCEYISGNISEAILLVKAALGYKWFEELFRDWPVCFLRERLSFVREDGDDSGQSKQGTAIFYFGKDIKKFASEFVKLGRIIPPEDFVNAALFKSTER